MIPLQSLLEVMLPTGGTMSDGTPCSNLVAEKANV